MAGEDDPDSIRRERDAGGADPDDSSASGADAGAADGFAQADEAAPAEATRPIDDDLTAAVQAARAGPYVPGGRFEPPRSIAMLIFVLTLLVGMAVYGLVWTRNLVATNDRIRLRTLEERAAKYAEQERFVRANGFLPAGREAEPLAPDERAELESLRATYGTPKPATAPAAAPGVEPDPSPATTTTPADAP